MIKHEGIIYQKPRVKLLNAPTLGIAELAGRVCYDSFENSENEEIREFLHQEVDLTNTQSSELLETLTWTHFHHSVLEHVNFSFYIEGTSRAVLQEHSRHRIQSLSVRSTRYTLSSVLYAYIASLGIDDIRERLTFFRSKLIELDMFVTLDVNYNSIEIEMILRKLDLQRQEIGNLRFFELALSPSNREVLNNSLTPDDLYSELLKGKKRRNAGDSFKHVVTDNWKVNLVCTMNLRALKNYMSLRDSSSAWFQIRWLAAEMLNKIPDNYKKLIRKEKCI